MAAMAVDSVVLGPGVKLMAVAKASRAVNSTKGMEKRKAAGTGQDQGGCNAGPTREDKG